MNSRWRLFKINLLQLSIQACTQRKLKKSLKVSRKGAWKLFSKIFLCKLILLCIIKIEFCHLSPSLTSNKFSSLRPKFLNQIPKVVCTSNYGLFSPSAKQIEANQADKSCTWKLSTIVEFSSGKWKAEM